MKMIAFWKYDIYPFCLWGELVRAEADRFYVKGYEGFCFSNKARIAFLPAVQAKAVIAKLEKLKTDKENMEAIFRQEAEKVLESI